MKTALALLSSLCIMATQVPPVAETGSVSSTNATYDGNALLLSGHVVLDHGLGKMIADEASLQKQEIGKDFPFSVIQLRNEVHLSLKNHAELLCYTADLDFNSLKGILHSKEGESKVVYKDAFKKKKENVPFSLTGETVELLFSKQGEEGKKTDYAIETVLIKEDVLIDYASLFSLTADHALYRTNISQQTTEFQGIITAYPKDSTTRCCLTHKEDVIHADMVDLDLFHSKLTLLHPTGRLVTSFIDRTDQDPMRFSSDQLIWDHLANTLTLRGHVQIEENSLGSVTSSDELRLVQTLVKGKHLLKEIHSQGQTTLVYTHPSFDKPHRLMCYGKMDIDRNKLHATLDSPEKEGRVPSDKQIYYEEEAIGVFADKANLEYALNDSILQPVSLLLKGNIRLFSHDPKQPPRCGVADRLNYSMTTRTLILAADPGKKVLFWDESQGLRMSATEVHIVYDPETKQHTVKGVGKVQFALSPEEQLHLKQLFPYYKVTHE